MVNNEITRVLCGFEKEKGKKLRRMHRNRDIYHTGVCTLLAYFSPCAVYNGRTVVTCYVNTGVAARAGERLQ